MKIAVLLSGCGVYDGAEIHESVFTLLCLDRLGAEVTCLAPDIDQHHVVNHTTGEEMEQKRNVFVEAARIARGNIKKLSEVQASDFDAVVLPGGFGVAKNFTKWAFSGPGGEINSTVKNFLVKTVELQNPLGVLCMAPTTLAKALEDSTVELKLSVGNTNESSPYDISAISEGMKATGAKALDCSKTDVLVDDAHNIVSSPCYMMDASISEIYEGIEKAMTKLVELTTLKLENN